MSTVNMLRESHEMLDVIDERFLAAVHALLRTYRQQGEEVVIGYRVGTDEPILASEADDTFEAIVAEVKAGNCVDVDELIAEKSARW